MLPLANQCHGIVGGDWSSPCPSVTSSHPYLSVSGCMCVSCIFVYKDHSLCTVFDWLRQNAFLTFLSDPFLPRVCELCVSSSDRQTKVCLNTVTTLTCTIIL